MVQQHKRYGARLRAVQGGQQRRFEKRQRWYDVNQGQYGPTQLNEHHLILLYFCGDGGFTDSLLLNLVYLACLQVEAISAGFLFIAKAYPAILWLG